MTLLKVLFVAMMLEEGLHPFMFMECAMFVFLSEKTDFTCQKCKQVRFSEEKDHHCSGNQGREGLPPFRTSRKGIDKNLGAAQT